ncbi:ABC transporter permease [Allorhizocola rhizosphaerae]|uniref:ABC transporter permease n=1 Tax=Allorhizocola rhizosphaerae TaxID=1872709 RepID=UPI000E3C0D55|nr:ABC transporter permease [Allorhizocola rhizosphaerae]
MTATTVPGVSGVDSGFWTRQRKTGVVLVALGLIAAVVFGLLATSKAARFAVGETTSGFALSIPGTLGAVLFGVLAIAAGAVLAATGRRFGLWTALSLAAFVASFLCWQVSQAPGTLNTLALGNLAKGSLELSLPLVLGALGGVLCERSGVVNVAIEGQFIAGAFAAAMFGTIAGSIWAGIIAASIGGLLISALLAVLAIRYLVDQVILGIVLNVFALSLTAFLYEQFMQKNQDAFNKPPRVPQWDIPVLGDIPIIGPTLFKANIFVYVALALVVAIHFGLFKTRWGLRTRAVGEHPTAADTLGVKVLGLRYRNVLLAGLVAGIGGATFTLLATTNFNKGMTSGLGFIALAALIFGRWNPVGAFLAALFFGFANQLAFSISALNSPIPTQFLSMLPYVATIVAVAGLVGRVRAPAADGKPYVYG